MHIASILGLSISLLIAVVLVFAMLRGVRAIDREQEARKAKMKKEEHSIITTAGQVLNVSPPTPSQRDGPTPADWGGIPMPSDHNPGDDHGHGGTH
jgi:hypothetical protein